MNMLAIWYFTLVVTVVTFMHWFPAFSIRYRTIPGRRCVLLQLYKRLRQITITEYPCEIQI